MSFAQGKNKQFVIAALKLLRSLQSVVHSDARKDLILYDSSPYEAGAVLSYGTKMTAECMIGFMSRTISSREGVYFTC